MATWDIDARLNCIQQTYIKHPQVVRIRTQLELHWKYGLRLRESTTSLIVGHSRCGKSETLKRFVKEKTGKRVPSTSEGTAQLIEGNGHRIVYLDTMNGATPLQASQTIADQIFTNGLKFSETQASQKVIDLFTQHDVDLLVIDEGQKMTGADGIGAASDKFVNWLISMENSRKFRIIVAGGPGLQMTIDHHPMLRDRKDAVQLLQPFAHATDRDVSAFGNFLRQFEKHMPFLSTPLSDPALQDAFFYASRGRPGKLAKFLEKATQIAFLRNKEKPVPHLTAKHLAEAFEIALLGETQMLGVNPFDHSGSLPTIPLNVDQEGYGFDPDEPPRGPRPKGSRIQRRPK